MSPLEVEEDSSFATQLKKLVERGGARKGLVLFPSFIFERKIQKFLIFDQITLKKLNVYSTQGASSVKDQNEKRKKTQNALSEKKISPLTENRI